ncbi:hypothetical protein ABTM16_19795, partial [Acinetobacter baumannii]
GVTEALAQQPHARLSDIQVLDQAGIQRAMLTSAPWPYRGTLSVAARFAEVAKLHAARTALAWPGGRMTYAELLQQSTRLACALR